jgi:hypothetical protein
MHPKKGEDEHDDDDQTDEINDSVHCGLPWIRSMRVERIDCAFRSALAAQQLWPTSSRGASTAANRGSADDKRRRALNGAPKAPQARSYADKPSRVILASYSQLLSD